MKKPTVTIFCSPWFYFKSPQLAAPLLKAYLNANNIDSNYIDLGIKFNFYLGNNRDLLYQSVAPYVSALLEEKIFQDKKELSEDDLRMFKHILEVTTFFPKEFLESKLNNNVIFADRDFPKPDQTKLEDVIRLYALINANYHLISDRNAKICEDPIELKNRFLSGIYNQFYESESIRPILQQAAGSDVVAISANYETQLFPALVLANKIKQFNPNTFTIIGGTNISRSSFEPRFSQVLLNDFEIDAIGLYEGETTLKELAFCIAQQGDPRQVPNLLFKDRDTEEIIATPIVEPPHLDELPTPEYNPEDLDLYWKIGNNVYDYLRLSVLVSRGCYWSKCHFCIDRLTFNPETRVYQTRSVDKIINDIQTLQTKHRATYFNLITSAMAPKTAEEFSRAVINQGIFAKFWTYFRCGNEKTMDREFFYLLRKAGFETVIIGAESFNDSVLSVCNKGATRSDNIYTLRCMAEAGIKIKLNMIYDLPPTRKEEFDENIRVINQYAKYIYELDMAFFLLLGRTEIGNNPEKYGLKVNYDENHHVANSGPPYFGVDDYQNPLFDDIPRDEITKMLTRLEMDIDLHVWTRELREKITSLYFSWEDSLLLLRPILAIKYPYSHAGQGKKSTVYYVFIEGYLSCFEIPESFGDLISLMRKAVQHGIPVSDFFNAFNKGCASMEHLNGVEEIKQKFQGFIWQLVAYGFVKDIINDVHIRSERPDMNSFDFSAKDNQIAVFYDPTFVPNVAAAM